MLCPFHAMELHLLLKLLYHAIARRVSPSVLCLLISCSLLSIDASQWFYTHACFFHKKGFPPSRNIKLANDIQKSDKHPTNSSSGRGTFLEYELTAKYTNAAILVYKQSRKVCPVSLPNFSLVVLLNVHTIVAHHLSLSQCLALHLPWCSPLPHKCCWIPAE